jgi:plastocyanin
VKVLLVVLVGLVAVVTAARAPASAAALRGQVLYAGPPPPPRKLPVTVDQYVCGKDKDAEDLVLSARRGIRFAVVWLTDPPAAAARPIEASAPPPSAAPQMDQKQCSFTPRVVLVPGGGTVEFLNSDRLLHNLHATPRHNASFSRTQPKGRTIPVTFARPEFIPIACDLHSWMRGWVVVTDHPFYAVTDGEGAFALGEVPPGRYTLGIWQETLGTVTRSVEVTGADVTLTVEIPR